MPITKMLSSSSIQQMQVESNRNASWMSERFWWPVYIGIIVALRLLAFFLPLSDNAQWTATNVVHGALSYWALHFNRGSPLWEDQGEHINQTVWEQIDNGVPWTATKKFFLVVELALFLIVCYATDWDRGHLAVNTVVVVWLFVAKLPELDGVRFFNINRAPSSATKD